MSFEVNFFSEWRFPLTKGQPCHVTINEDGGARVEAPFNERDNVLLKPSFCPAYICRCSRQHPRPSSSVTLMIPAMYNDIRLSQSMLDEADQDTSLEVSFGLLVTRSDCVTRQE